MTKRQTKQKGRNNRMKRFVQLISVIAAIAALLGCLCASAAAESPTGSLTVKIQENDQGISTAGITLNLYRIGGKDGDTWKLDSAFEDTEYLEAWQKQNSDMMSAALKKIRKIVTDNGMAPTVSGKSDKNGVVRFDNLPRGIYFGLTTDTPQEMTVQNFAAHIPEAGSGKMNAEAILKYKVDVPKEATTYTVTIRYVYEDGTTAHKTYKVKFKPGAIYDVYSPMIEGYTASEQRVNGKMPARDLQFTVIYVRNDDSITIVPEYDTPLGLGNIQMHVGVCIE